MVKMFRVLQIVAHYQKSLIIHREILCFRKLSFGSQNPRSCRHNWSDNYPWLHCDIEKDCVVCFYCMKNVSKLIAEKNKEPAYTSVGLKIGKRHPSLLKITKTVNATKKQQRWQLSFTDRLDLCKIGNDFISKNNERYNQFERFTEVLFIF